MQCRPAIQRRSAAALMIVAALATATGCVGKPEAPSPSGVVESGGSEAPNIPTPSASSGPWGGFDVVPATSGSAKVGVGDQLVLDIGEYNPSVGDDWDVLESSDPDIVDTEPTEENLGQNGEDGAPSRLGIRVVGQKPGTTELTLKYCFRDKISATCDQSLRGDKKVDDIKIKVTVE